MKKFVKIGTKGRSMVTKDILIRLQFWIRLKSKMAATNKMATWCCYFPKRAWRHRLTKRCLSTADMARSRDQCCVQSIFRPCSADKQRARPRLVQRLRWLPHRKWLPKRINSSLLWKIFTKCTQKNRYWMKVNTVVENIYVSNVIQNGCQYSRHNEQSIL